MKHFYILVPATLLFCLSISAQNTQDVIDYAKMDLTKWDKVGFGDYKDPTGWCLYSPGAWMGGPSAFGCRFGPPTATFFSTDIGDQNCYMPLIVIGNHWGGFMSKNVDVPARICDYEILKGSYVSRIPNWDGTKHTRITGSEPNIDEYRIYYQMGLSNTAAEAKSTEGDWCIVFYQTPTTSPIGGNTKKLGDTTVGNHTFMMLDYGMNCCGGGPFRTAVLKPYAMPDAYGIIRAYNIDILGCTKYYCDNGRGFNSQKYMHAIYPTMEVFNIKGTWYCLDVAFYIKLKGKAAQLVPPWTTLGWTFGLERTQILPDGTVMEKRPVQKNAGNSGLYDVKGRVVREKSGTGAGLRVNRDIKKRIAGFAVK